MISRNKLPQYTVLENHKPYLSLWCRTISIHDCLATVEGEKRCELCEEKAAQLKLQSSIQSSSILLKINSGAKSIFTNPVEPARYGRCMPTISTDCSKPYIACRCANVYAFRNMCVRPCAQSFPKLYHFLTLHTL